MSIVDNKGLAYFYRKLDEQQTTNAKVTQTPNVTNNDFPLLASVTAQKTKESTEGATFSKDITINPANGSIRAKRFVTESGIEFF